MRWAHYDFQVFAMLFLTPGSFSLFSASADVPSLRGPVRGLHSHAGSAFLNSLTLYRAAESHSSLSPLWLFPSKQEMGSFRDTSPALHRARHVFLFVSLNICMVGNEPDQSPTTWMQMEKSSILTILGAKHLYSYWQRLWAHSG